MNIKHIFSRERDLSFNSLSEVVHSGEIDRAIQQIFFALKEQSSSPGIWFSKGTSICKSIAEAIKYDT